MCCALTKFQLKAVNNKILVWGCIIKSRGFRFKFIRLQGRGVLITENLENRHVKTLARYGNKNANEEKNGSCQEPENRIT